MLHGQTEDNPQKEWVKGRSPTDSLSVAEPGDSMTTYKGI